LLHLLRRHPFGVQAFFRHSLVLTYALPAPSLEPLIGPGLELDRYGDRAFLAIAMVQTETLRPQGFPQWLGRNFFLSGYRIFTRFPRPGKKPLRGLRILRSDTDRASMARIGNVFTHYHYRRSEVELTHGAERLEVRIRTRGQEADLHVVADLSSRPARLPEGSPFRSMADARMFAGPLPYTFSFDEHARKMVVIKGVRTSWEPEPVRVEVKEASFLQQFDGAARLANAFYLRDVPYRWKPGTLEPIA
jgi:hypothetical protein